MRSPADPSKPLGPAWIENALLDLTAIGGSTVLGLVVLSVVGFLLLPDPLLDGALVTMTAISGEVLNNAMKATFNRPRSVDCAASAGCSRPAFRAAMRWNRP